MPVLRVTRDSSEVDEAVAAWEYERSKPPELQVVLNPVLLARKAGIEPDPWQARFLLSDAKRILLNCSRQTGKSTIAAVLAVHGAVYEPRTLTLLLSPGLRQSKELFDKCRDIYSAIGRPVVTESETALQMRLQNGSRIVSLPGNAGRIRGYSGARRIIIDEAAWVPDELYRSVRPMLAVSGGDLIAMSTPFGMRGWWYEAWSQPEQEKLWQRYEVNATECPRISAEFLAEEEATLPEDWFAQEYMCQFSQAGDAVFKASWYERGANRYNAEDLSLPRRCIGRWTSWDTGMKDKETSDYASGLVAELSPAYVLQVRHVTRKRLKFPDLVGEIESNARQWNYDGKLRGVVIEDKVSGTSAYQTLASATADPWLARLVVPFNPPGSKVHRGSLAGVWCKNGMVQIPHPSEAVPWLSTFESELFAFPNVQYDDQVDTFTQLILYLEATQKIMSTGFHARQAALRARGIA